jgi:pimeloyl-ACP methyl ester carboxylesterase
MKINNYVLYRVVSVLLAVVIFGCASIQIQKQEATSTVLSKDGNPISFGVKGQGETTIVFVHCWRCDHTFWKPQINYFSNKYRVMWLDLAGHGLSGSTRADYTMNAFGEDVAAVVNKVGANKVILVGHSMGGTVSIEAAKILGHKVVAIVGVDIFYTPTKYPKSEADIEDFVKPFKKDFIGSLRQMVLSMFTPEVDPELKASIVKQFSGSNPEEGISALSEVLRWMAKNVPHSLESYSNKLHNINSAPAGNEAALHESVTLIPGVGHFVPQVKPDEFNAALNRIISEYQ